MAEEFIERFHNLEGVLLKEKKKSLFLLLEGHISLHAEYKTLQEIIDNLKPKTYLEEIFKLELLLYFKRSSELFELLKTGNDIISSKIIRQSWFIQTLLKNRSTEEFVQNVFPQLSVLVRAKILKQFLKVFKNEECINGLFNALLNKYGFKPAIILLSGCSVDKIKEILLSRGLKLSKSQMKLLHDKDPLLIDFYYAEFHRKGENMYNLRNFTKYLSKKNPNLYVKLLLQYQFNSYKLGRKTTKKYVSENMESIMADPEKYLNMNIFHKHTLVKVLGDGFPLFLKAAFPKKLSELTKSHAFTLLKYYHKRGRYDIYRITFEDVYVRSIFTNKQFITKDLIEVIQNNLEREKWVEKFENQIEYIKYKRSSVAVAELKEQLMRCNDVTFREQLFKYIVTSCSMGEDYDALLDILRFFCNRFRNTDGSVFSGFLGEIHKKIKLDKLTEEHWKCIHEIILIQNLRNLSINGFIVFEYSKFLYKTGKEFEELIPIYLKADNFSLRKIKFKNDKFRDERFQKQFLELTLKYYSNEKDSLRISTDIVLAIRDWNKRHPKDLIIVSEKKEIVEAIKKSVTAHSGRNECSSMKYLVCRENMHEEFTDIYFDRIGRLENATMTKWYLKYIPTVFQKNIHKVVECFDMKGRYNLLKIFKKYEHIDLVDSITKYYLNKLKEPNEEKKDEIVQLLASIMPENDYLKMLEEHAPKTDKLDIIKASLDETNFQKIQIALAKSVRFTTCQREATPTLLKYCRGDYFQPSLFSLYSCFNRIPEKSLEVLLNLLLQKPVSVRKHAIFLAALVFPIKTNEELIQLMYDGETNDSVRDHLFTSSYKYFLKNPLEQFWNILKTHMSHLTSDQTESLILTTDIQNVPEAYKCRFMKQVCKVFNDIETNQGIPMNEYYDKLMNNLKDDDMRLLTSELCLDIITKKLIKDQYKKNNVCVDFTIKFLMYGSNMRENIKTVFSVLGVYKREHWTGPNWIVTRSVIYSICKDIFDKTMNRKALRIQLQEDFPLLLSEEWKQLFSIHETLEEYLMLDFMIMKYRNFEDLTSYASEINKISGHLRQSYGDSISVLFKNFLSFALKPLLGVENYDLQLIKLLVEILEIDCSQYNCLLVVQLLPSYQSDHEFITKYHNVLEKLRAGDQVVQLFFNTHFKEKIYF